MLFRSPLIKVTNIANALRELNKAGFWIYDTLAENGTDLDLLDPEYPLVLVMGNEHKGVSPLVSKQAHDHIKIPMQGEVQSLNVSVAAGIVLYKLTEKIRLGGQS